MANNPIEYLVSLFGFQLTKEETPEKEQKENLQNPSFVVPQSDDGAVTITAGSHFSQYLDFDYVSKNEIELITKYREISMQPELEAAINQIVNEAIVTVDEGSSISLNLDKLKGSDSLKDKIEDEFEYILKLMDFKNLGQDLFRRWYIDGRLNFQCVINDDKPKDGIQELRYIDPRRIKKIREVTKEKDQRTGIEIVSAIKEYYLYNEFGQISNNINLTSSAKIAKDSIISTTSGLMDSRRIMVISFLSKAIKPLNQLRMVEDAMVINQMVRGPDRRVFYIGTGNMPRVKAEQYMKSIIDQYKSKMVYDADTGAIRNDTRHLGILEDIWIPVRENDAQSTRVETLQGADNLNQTNLVEYLNKKLYRSLEVPVSRLDPQDGFLSGFGQSTSVTREEVNFNKFIERLRNRFSIIFDEALRTQLVLKGFCSLEEWNEIKEVIRYDFKKDNNFEELKEAELWTQRLQMLTMADPFVGKYMTKEFLMKNFMKLDDQEIKKMKDQMDKEQVENDLMGPGNSPQYGSPMQGQGGGFGAPDQGGGFGPPQGFPQQ